MPLVRLIYVSKFRAGVDPSVLAEIHRTAIDYNRKSDITGILLFGNDYFLQCLEGGRKAVTQLYSKIIKDPRHENAELLAYEEISVRDFSQWSMKLTLMTERTREDILKYATSGEFNPYSMSAASSLELLRSLRARD